MRERACQDDVEPLHLPFSSSRRTMRVLSPITQISALSVLDARKQPPLGAAVADLAATLNAADADMIVAGTPVDLTRLAQLNKPVVRARYDYADLGAPGLGLLVDELASEIMTGAAGTRIANDRAGDGAP
jgi:hypothetical protein